jgi:hypothetical protein
LRGLFGGPAGGGVVAGVVARPQETADEHDSNEDPKNGTHFNPPDIRESANKV